METNKIEIVKGPSIEKMGRIYSSGSRKDVCFEVYFGINRTAFVDIIEIKQVLETHVKMLGSIPAGFFIYSQGEDPRPYSEKTQRIQVHIFYTTNTRTGYIEKIPEKVIDASQKEERRCPRCKGSTYDPYYLSHCHRCGGTGRVFGPESAYKPYPFAD